MWIQWALATNWKSDRAEVKKVNYTANLHFIMMFKVDNLINLSFFQRVYHQIYVKTNQIMSIHFTAMAEMDFAIDLGTVALQQRKPTALYCRIPSTTPDLSRSFPFSKSFFEKIGKFLQLILKFLNVKRYFLDECVTGGWIDCSLLLCSKINMSGYIIWSRRKVGAGENKKVTKLF